MRALLVVAFAAFPLVLYVLADRMEPAAVIALFAALAALRILLANSLPQNRRLMLLLALALFVAAALAAEQLTVLLFYPVLLSLCAIIWFAYTLWQPPSAIERLARLAGMAVDAEGSRYTRGVTWLWLCFFMGNAAVAAWTAAAGDLARWSFYNGLLSYLLVAVLFLGEWLFRGFYRRRLAARQ